jgi:type VI secretion system protein ImpH
MAGAVGQEADHIKRDLLEKGHEFSFAQAIRLLRLAGARAEAPLDPADCSKAKQIRILPNNSLSFPPADIAGIDEIEGEVSRFRVTANFLGLYGHSSPLPTFYSEELLDEATLDESVSRDFLDIFNHRIFALFYRCSLKYSLFFQLMEEAGSEVEERLFCLAGLGSPLLREDMEIAVPLCRYLGLITQYPHSACGLETILRDAFSGVLVEVVQCIKRTVKIPPHQLISVGSNGCSLGIDSCIGGEVEDATGQFRLRIGPVSLEDFNRMLPGNPLNEKLIAMTRFYLVEPLQFDIELILAENECRPIRIGMEMSRLGLDAWVFSSSTIGEMSAVFPGC